MSTEQRFEERRLGSGSYGDVYELIGHQPPAVIKYPKRLTPKVLEMFQEESRIMGQISHSNIINLIRVQEADGSRDYGIVMDYCHRDTLKSLIFDPKVMYSMRRVIHWAYQLFDALHYMFTIHSIVHRDIKAENIFVTLDFDLKVGDFGMFKIIEHTCSGTFTGTPRYMSPPQYNENGTFEQMMKTDHQASHRNDVYSMGLVLWEIIERRLVWSDYDRDGHFDQVNFLTAIISKKLARLDPPKCHPEIQKLIEKCTSFNRFSRPKSGAVLKQILLLAFDKSGLPSKLFAFLSPMGDYFQDLEMLPIVDENQKTLWKPLDFDAQQSTTRSASDNENDNIFRKFEHYRMASRRESLRDVLSKRFLESFFEGNNETFLPTFLPTFRPTFQRVLDEAMERTYKMGDFKNIFDILFDFDVRNKLWALEVLNIAKLFELYILTDIYALWYWLQSTLLLIWAYSRPPTQNKKRRDWICPWNNYGQVLLHKTWFDGLKRKYHLIRFRGKHHFFPSDPGQARFDNSQTYARAMNDMFKTYKREYSFLQVEGKGTEMIQGTTSASQTWSHKARIYEEEFNLDEIYDTLSRDLAYFEQLTKLEIASWIPLEEIDVECRNLCIHPDSPLPGYVFQLRNPPRPVCHHQPNCPLKGHVSVWSPFKADWFSDFPETMQIPIYKCTRAKNLEQLDLFVIFLKLFDEWFDHKWSHYVPEFVALRKVKLSIEEKFTFLTIENFLFSPTLNGEQYLIFLDHPNNYQDNELIKCFTFCRDLYEAGADIAKEVLKKTPVDKIFYTVIDVDGTAQLFKSNGQKVTNEFDLDAPSSWPYVFEINNSSCSLQ